MTKAEAIELLRELSNFVATPPETDEAVNMAIKALEQEPCDKRTDKRTGTHACDCISRQAAIDALYDKGLSMTAWGELLAMKWSDIQTCIELLPSAQPFTAEQIQTMQELESAQVEKAYELGKADRPTGHWIENDNGTFSCSNCQSWIPKEQHHYARHCLYCGARMESEQ